MERKPICSSQPPRRSGSGGVASRASTGSGSGASRRSSTRRRETRAASACATSASRCLDAFIEPTMAASSTRSTVPYSRIRAAAFLGPMPGTPGTLSTLSPIKAWTSTIRRGGTPNFSSISAGPIGFCLIGSSMSVPPPTTCIRSLSDDTMVQRPPVDSMNAA